MRAPLSAAALGQRGQRRVAIGQATDVGHEGLARPRSAARSSRRARSTSASHSGTVSIAGLSRLASQAGQAV